MQRLGGKVPGYAATIVKESEDKTFIEGTKKEKSSDLANDDFEGDSMFDNQSEMVGDEIPEKV